MRVFVRNYFDATKNPVRAGNVMKCFTKETLPVLYTLAKEYAVRDRWFASVPGSTIVLLHAAGGVRGWA